MLPLRDNVPTRTTPVVNYVLIAANVAVFFHELALGRGLQRFIDHYALVPLRYAAPALIHKIGVTAWLAPFFTSMFLHGGWLHIIGNMWVLWIFGDNVEDRLGHGWYLLFYLICGVAAALFHTLLNAGSTVPTVGASGAIAGVMGAYFLLYPRARVLTLVPLFFVFFMWLPAWVVLGFWFVVQFLSGAATSIGSHSGSSSGIAFWAHVGGFLAGMLLIKLFPARAQRYHYGV